MDYIQNFDVIIVGGSYAGLSAAMALGRSLRNVLVLDSGRPCNRQTPYSHNFLTRDGEAPANIAAKAKEQALKYESVSFVEDLVIEGVKRGGEFEICTVSGRRYKSAKLIFATGVADQMPQIDGFAECWGISVVHCPYCHGYEFRNEKTAILATGERAMHLASLVRNLSADLSILSGGTEGFTADQYSSLDKQGIQVIDKKLVSIDHDRGYLKKLVFSDGSSLPFTAMYAAVPFAQHSDVPAKLGCEISEQGYINIDSMFRTSVGGVYACGDNSSPMRSVANAVYSGNFTGAIVNKELVEERF